MTPYTVRRRVAAHKRARALSEWLRRYSTGLAGMLGDPPAWQLMPEGWGPQNVPEEVTTTVVGARAAKTTRSEICHTGEGVLEVDVKLLEGGEDQGRRDPPPPMCQTIRGQVPLDARLMRLLIFLFRVQRLHDPPAQCEMDMETTRGAVGDLGEGEAVMLWARAGEEERLWQKRGQCREHVVVVTRRPPPADLQWIRLTGQGVAAFRYMVACKHHDCGGPPDRGEVYIAVLQGGPLRHEVDEALGGVPGGGL